MTIIKLTKGFETIVDDEDVEKIFSECLHWSVDVRGNNAYARAFVRREDNKIHIIKLHRLILGEYNPKIHIDHIDGNGLNNKKNNLRRCTPSQNSANIKKNSFSQHLYKGTILMKRNPPLKKPWSARVKYLGKNHYLGTFEKEEDAALAYDKKALEFYGEFAKINFPINIRMEN